MNWYLLSLPTNDDPSQFYVSLDKDFGILNEFEHTWRIFDSMATKGNVVLFLNTSHEGIVQYLKSVFDVVLLTEEPKNVESYPIVAGFRS